MALELVDSFDALYSGWQIQIYKQYYILYLHLTVETCRSDLNVKMYRLAQEQTSFVYEECIYRQPLLSYIQERFDLIAISFQELPTGCLEPVHDPGTTP